MSTTDSRQLSSVNGVASRTILVIEDEEMVRTVVDCVLVRAGYRVLTAGDGIDGLKVFRKHHGEIAAVLLDMTMPRMGGEETLHELRRLDPKVPIILSSGFDEADASLRFADKKLAEFLQKPYHPQALVRKLRDVLDG